MQAHNEKYAAQHLSGLTLFSVNLILNSLTDGFFTSIVPPLMYKMIDEKKWEIIVSPR